MNFISRKNYEYEGSLGTYVNNSSLVLDNGELIFDAPYYVRFQGFTFTPNNYDAAEYDSLYSVLDSVTIAFSNHYSESAIQQIITRGKDRITALSFTHEDELVNTLNQAAYSMSLIFDLDDEMGGGFGFYINPCLLAGALADVVAFNYFSEIGDMDFGPTAGIARELIRGVSTYAYSRCYCTCQ